MHTFKSPIRLTQHKYTVHAKHTYIYTLQLIHTASNDMHSCDFHDSGVWQTWFHSLCRWQLSHVSIVVWEQHNFIQFFLVFSLEFFESVCRKFTFILHFICVYCVDLSIYNCDVLFFNKMIQTVSPYKLLYSLEDQTCNQCFKSIPSNILLIAKDGQQQQVNGKTVRCTDKCYHVGCFFKIHRLHTDADFDGFADLRCADQLMIKEHLCELLLLSIDCFFVFDFVLCLRVRKTNK